MCQCSILICLNTIIMEDFIKEVVGLSINDSIFSEADLIARRIETETIYEDLDDDFMLDSTREPVDFFNLTAENSIKELPEVKTNVTSEEIFKTVDKILASRSHQTTSEVNISQERKKINRKSKETRDILNRLYAIFTMDESLNEQNISEGQNLLSSLGEILLSSDNSKSKRNQNLDDSAHSSIEDKFVPVAGVKTHNHNETYSIKNCNALSDLSLKSKSISFIEPNPNFNLRKENKSTRSNYSKFSNESRNSDNKFKAKKIETKEIKKGAVKVVVPIDTMAKRSDKAEVLATPTKPKQKSLNFKLNKSNTPSRPSLKPMAHSTPDTVHF